MGCGGFSADGISRALWRRKRPAGGAGGRIELGGAGNWPSRKPNLDSDYPQAIVAILSSPSPASDGSLVVAQNLRNAIWLVTGEGRVWPEGQNQIR